MFGAHKISLVFCKWLITEIFLSLPLCGVPHSRYEPDIHTVNASGIWQMQSLLSVLQVMENLVLSREFPIVRICLERFKSALSLV